MARSPALKELAELISLMCSEHRRLKQRCADLETKVAALARKGDTVTEPAAVSATASSLDNNSGSQFDKKLVQSKLEEMLAELADIG